MHLKQIALRSARPESSVAPGVPAIGDPDDHSGTDPFDDASPPFQALRDLEGDVVVQRKRGPSGQADAASVSAQTGFRQASFDDPDESSGESSASTNIKTDWRRVHVCECSKRFTRHAHL
ncbi:hypothetical protein HK405_001213, partial [Cladochytrium tenue]